MYRFSLFSLTLLLAVILCRGADREVVIVNPGEGTSLAGTLSTPAGKAKAALVLATGSGQQDRDETVFGHKPFKAIAERLSENGYAVLRLDDRGVGGSIGPTENLTTANFVADIGHAMHWLDSTLVDVPVGVLGHSEGAQIAYRIAAKDSLCRFIVTLAGPAWRGDSLVMAQCRALSVGATGRWDGEANQRTILDVAMSNMPESAARLVIMAEIAKTMGNASSMPQMQQFIMTQTNLVLLPWYREFLRYDPEDDIRLVKVPWLALNGDKDTQVPSANLVTIADLCPTARTELLPDHNHLFQHAVTGLPNEYQSIPEDISTETTDIIISFLNEL